MAQVLVRNLPEDIVARLKAKAAALNTSLEQYLRDLIESDVVGARDERIERLRQFRESQPRLEGDLGDLIGKQRKERNSDIERALRGEA